MLFHNSAIYVFDNIHIIIYHNISYYRTFVDVVS